MVGPCLRGPAWRPQASLRERWGLKRLVVCFKTRDAAGLQRRWSALADVAGVHTTLAIPVFHTPKDECGGGSAWATASSHSVLALRWLCA